MLVIFAVSFLLDIAETMVFLVFLLIAAEELTVLKRIMEPKYRILGR